MGSVGEEDKMRKVGFEPTLVRTADLQIEKLPKHSAITTRPFPLILVECLIINYEVFRSTTSLMCITLSCSLNAYVIRNGRVYDAFDHFLLRDFSPCSFS